MQLVEIDRSGVEACYQAGMVKPNEFRQIFMDLLAKEVQLRLESTTPFQAVSALFTQEYFLEFYQKLAGTKDDLVQCVIDIATSEPELLLIDQEEAKRLFLSYVFYRKAVIVRDCSDIFKHELVESSTIMVDKETLRAIEYLSVHSSGGRDLIKTYYQN